jgi:predicted phage terminase large subunit-like protein
VTGSRGDRVLIDDPISVQDSFSETILKSKEMWFTEAVPTRLNNPSSSAIVVIMQRLNEKDTTGIILERNMGYTHLMLPMEFERSRKCFTSIGFEDPRKEEGELIFPERFSQDVVKSYRESMGSFAIAGQMQQRPQPREGGIVKVAWFKYYKLKRDLSGNIILNDFKLIYQSLDTAFKEGEENDYSVLQTWGLTDNGFYLISQMRERLEFPELERRSIILINQFKPNAVLVEDKASGQSLLQVLRKKTALPIKPIKVDRDKVARLNATSGFIENGRVFLPEGEMWVDDYVTELTTFPAGAHDDQVDATTQFLMEVALRREVKHNIPQGSMIAR